MKVEELLKAKRKIYSLLRSRVKKAKKDLLTNQDTIDISCLKDLRKKLATLFTMHTSEICKVCQGKCCDGCVPWPDDILYYALINFELPEPDWEFIRLRLLNCQSASLFLSREGCFLGENKPYHCLTSLCSQFSVLPAEIRSEIEDLVDEIRREKWRTIDFLKKR